MSEPVLGVPMNSPPNITSFPPIGEDGLYRLTPVELMNLYAQATSNASTSKQETSTFSWFDIIIKLATIACALPGALKAAYDIGEILKKKEESNNLEAQMSEFKSKQEDFDAKMREFNSMREDFNARLVALEGRRARNPRNITPSNPTMELRSRS
ncbi:hypothetical protein N7456_006064 [Penicillium angulare]|uniref:Uncharacterized protein n=1 Tax=Penicillium angulare TaxID=116970 RepID=A0A9W9FZL4_9EURO|nr:hypothetical protein N7456_006064 [Penicillium angulare]